MRQHLQAICPVCDSPNCEKAYDDELGDELPTVDYNFSPQTRKTYQIVECVDCSHQFVHPLPNLTNIYQENVDDTYLNSAPQRRRSAQEWLGIVTTYAPTEASSLVDIGCATGMFLDEAAQRYRVEGIELSAWAADLASSRHQIHRMPVSERKNELLGMGATHFLLDATGASQTVMAQISSSGRVIFSDQNFIFVELTK